MVHRQARVIGWRDPGRPRAGNAARKAQLVVRGSASTLAAVGLAIAALGCNSILGNNLHEASGAAGGGGGAKSGAGAGGGGGGANGGAGAGGGGGGAKSGAGAGGGGANGGAGAGGGGGHGGGSAAGAGGSRGDSATDSGVERMPQDASADVGSGQVDCSAPSSCITVGGGVLGTRVNVTDTCPQGFSSTESTLYRGPASGPQCTGCACSVDFNCSSTVTGYSTINNCSNSQNSVTTFQIDDRAQICATSPAFFRITQLRPASVCNTAGAPAPPQISWVGSVKFCRADSAYPSCATGVCVPSLTEPVSVFSLMAPLRVHHRSLHIKAPHGMRASMIVVLVRPVTVRLQDRAPAAARPSLPVRRPHAKEVRPSLRQPANRMAQ